MAQGECGFAYIGNLVTTDEVARPIAISPLIPGTTRFDSKPFDGKAVVLWTDGSVTFLRVKKDSDSPEKYRQYASDRLE